MKNRLVELWQFRELLIALTIREIKVRYKQTLLGATWAVLQPFSLMIIFTLVFGLLLKISSEGIPYAIFAYSALVPWTFFATSLSFGSLSIVNNSNLVTKVYFPREILPIALLLATFLDFLIALIIFIVLMAIYEIPFTFNLIFLLPITLLLFVFTASLVIITSAINVIWRDIKFVIPLVVQLWMFVTPVIYPLSNVPEKLRVFYLLNPMAPIIDNFRKVSAFGKTPDWPSLFVATAVSLVVLIIGYIFFKNLERSFADII